MGSRGQHQQGRGAEETLCRKHMTGFITCGLRDLVCGLGQCQLPDTPAVLWSVVDNVASQE